MNNRIFAASHDGQSLIAGTGCFTAEEAMARAEREGVSFIVWYYLPVPLPAGATVGQIRDELDEIMGKRPWDR